MANGEFSTMDELNSARAMHATPVAIANGVACLRGGRAAHELPGGSGGICLDPTAISHQIRELETAFGTPLFRRRPRPLSLTPAGARLFPVLQVSFDAMEAAIASLREAEQRRPLRVTTTNAFAHRWLVPRLPLWRATHPGRALEVIGTDAVVDIRAGKLTLRSAMPAPHRPNCFTARSCGTRSGRCAVRACSLRPGFR